MDQYTVEELRDKALSSLYFFDKFILGFNSANYPPDYIGMEDEPHIEICQFVTDWSSGKKNKLIVVPRYCLKTSCITIGYSLFELAHDPSMTILIDSVERAIAASFLGQIRDILEKNPVFRGTFGDWVGERGWTGHELTIKQKPPGRTKEPSIGTAGVDSSKVAYHPRLAILDDLVNRETVRSREALLKTIRHYKDLKPMVGKDGRMLMPCTRWDQDDLVSYILENEADEWDVLIASAIKEDGTAYYIEKLPVEWVQKQLDDDPYFASCLPADAPVLMADWTEKPMSDIKVGDEVIGWENRENLPKGQKCSLIKSKVVVTNKRKSTLIEVKLKSGRKVYCTPNHHWYRNPSANPDRFLYRSPEIGGQMSFIYRQPTTSSFTDEEKMDLGWLGGMFDGEGSGDIQTIRIAQSKQHNPDICEKLEKVLTQFNFQFGYNENCGVYWLNGGKWERVRFLFLTNPVRRNRIIKTLLGKKDFIQEKDEIVEIIPESELVDVYNIQTETHNYIAYGYGSRNCQYLNDPVNPSATMFNRNDIEWYEKNEDLPEGTNYMTIDPAGSGGAGGDKTAVVPVKVDKTQNIYCLEGYYERYKPEDIVNVAFNAYTFLKIRRLGIEQNYFRGALAKNFERKAKEWGTRVRVEELKHYGRTQRKDDRISALQPWFADGKIFLKGKKITIGGKEQWVPEGPYMKAMYQQIVSYPHAKMSDDLIDALAMHLEIIKPSGGLDLSKIKVEKPVDALFGY